MQQALTIYRTTIGKKALMALTGIILIGFVIGHLVGNLQIYMGPQAINDYSAFLHGQAALLWAARLILLAAVGVHIWAAWSLATLNAEARPTRYKMRQDRATNYAARTMVWSGPILLLFIVYHLLHLTFGMTPGNYAHSEVDVYSNLVQGFQIWWVSLFYILAMCALGMHFFHGVWSLFQSLGLNHPKYNLWRRQLAFALTAFVVVGNISIPASVLLGWVE